MTCTGGGRDDRIPLSPVSFVTTADLARLEDWAASDRLLRRLAG
jgi:hypothetical protein